MMADTYSALGDFPGDKPRRRLFLRVSAAYPLIIAGTVSAIILAAGWPHNPRFVSLCVIGYWVYFAGFQQLSRDSQRRRIFDSERGRAIRAGVLLLGSSVLLWVLYRARGGDAFGGGDTLWLLYLLPIFLVSQAGDTRLVLVFTALSIVGLTLVTPRPEVYSFYLLLKALWLTLLAFVMHFLIRVIADRSANLRALHELQTQTMGDGGGDDDDVALLNRIVSLVSSTLGRSEVHLFERQPNGCLLLTASTSSDGTDLVRQGYSIPQTEQVPQADVVRSGTSLLLNDPRQARPSAPLSVTAGDQLVVPILTHNTPTGVLDVRADKYHLFSDEDVALCESIAAYVAKLLGNARLIRSQRQFGQIAASIGKRFLSQRELKPTLEDIAKAAHDELRADLVLLYQRHPLTNTVTLGAMFGKILWDDMIDRGPARRESLVEEFLASAESTRFDEDVVEGQTGPITDRSVAARAGFARREGIQSRAFIKLTTDLGHVGAMFLNYRSPVSFDEIRKEQMVLFGSLAALAIQKAQAQEQQLQGQRDQLTGALHDEFKSAVYGISTVVRVILRDGMLSEEHRSSLEVVSESLQDLSDSVNSLFSSQRDLPMADICNEVQKLVRVMYHTYGITSDVGWPDQQIEMPPAMVRELKLVSSEAMINAAKNGARHLGIVARVRNGRFTLSFKDDGPGFNPRHVTSGEGIKNMGRRVESLGGNLEIDSAVGAGTEVTASLPLPLWPQRVER